MFEVAPVAQDGPTKNASHVEGLMLLALQRVLGRLKRAERAHNRGNTMKYMQARSWLVSCIIHYNGNRPGELDRLKRLIDDLFESMSDDEDSPTHVDPEEVRTFRICAASEKLHHHFRLMEMDLCETTIEIHQLRCGATTKRDGMYEDAEQGEVSDPDLWASLHYGPAMEVEETENQDDGMMEF